MRPEILASRIVKRIDDYHAFLINRNKSGSMILPGESLFVLEMQPAAYAILACNEAEKAADVKVVDYRMMGATGRRLSLRRGERHPRRFRRRRASARRRGTDGGPYRPRGTAGADPRGAEGGAGRRRSFLPRCGGGTGEGGGGGTDARTRQPPPLPPGPSPQGGGEARLQRLATIVRRAHRSQSR